MPQTAEEWRDYEADRLMAKALAIRDEVQKTHSLDKLVEMQVAAIRQERNVIERISEKAVDDTPSDAH